MIDPEAAASEQPRIARGLKERRQDKLDAVQSMAVTLPRVLFAEIFGTWCLVTVAAGGSVINTVSGAQISRTALVVAPALMIVSLIYVLGPLSGAHFNPVVTLAFALRGDFPWRYVIPFWLSQLAGATLAALILKSIYGVVAHLGATIPRHGVGTSLVMEIILTLLLVTVILGTAADRKIVGHNASLAVGATIALDGLIGDPISGASMNPARSLGPAIASWHFADQWIYIVGPFAGTLLAVVVAIILRGGTTRDAKKAASGKLAR
jgi:aquaporin Z